MHRAIDLSRVLLSNFKTEWISLCLFFFFFNVVFGRALKMNKSHKIAFFANRTAERERESVTERK